MALTGRALEISVGTFIISFLILKDLTLSLGIAILNETICAITSYLNERVWNIVQWGRRIIHVGKGRKTELQNGIWEVEITLYKTGNVSIKRTNLITKKSQVFQTRKKNGKGYIE